MIGLIGKKIGMTGIFDENGIRNPCTVVYIDKNTVWQIKTKEKDGYDSVVLGFGKAKEKNKSKSIVGVAKKIGTDVKMILREIKDFYKENISQGQDIFINDVFKLGDTIKVIGISKGKGFQGVVKRHGFSGVGGQTHGQHNRERHPGSIGASSFPSRVFKGLRMAGRTGGDRVTVRNLEIIDLEEDLVVVRGCIPGCNGSFVLLMK